jgi:hypothetical protein
MVVGESTVRRYVAEAQGRSAVPLVEVKVPQTHPLGEEGEVDFGEVSFYLNDLPTLGWMFVMRLSASGKAFTASTPTRPKKCFSTDTCRPSSISAASPAASATTT